MAKRRNGLMKIAEPLVPAPMKAVNEAVWLYRQKRIDAWWRSFVGRTSVEPHDVEDEIFAAVADGDERTVQAIMDGARAAADSVDAAVLPSIAMIGRRYARGDVPSWFHRNAVAFLAELSATTFADLRDLLWGIEPQIRYAKIEVKLICSTTESRVMPDGGQQMKIDSVPAHPRRLFAALKAHQLAYDQGRAAHPAAVVLEPDVCAWLREAMPRPRTDVHS